MNKSGDQNRPPSLVRRIIQWALPPAIPQPEERESVWSISRRDARTFFRLVGLLWAASLAYIAVRQAGRPAAEWRNEWPLAADAPWWQYAGDFAMAVMDDFTGVGIGFAILAMLLTRPLNLAGDILMTLYQAMVNRFVTPVIERHKAAGRVEGRVEGRAEGQAAERSQWQDWNRRRLDAAAAGRPFHEPPPGED